jgi:hypothetical protein
MKYILHNDDASYLISSSSIRYHYKQNELDSTVNLRDCRKSPKRAILAILHVMKSNSYEHQKHKFRVFRQSLHLKETNLRTQDSFVLNRFALIATITVERDMTTAPAAGGSRN